MPLSRAARVDSVCAVHAKIRQCTRSGGTRVQAGAKKRLGIERVCRGAPVCDAAGIVTRSPRGDQSARPVADRPSAAKGANQVFLARAAPLGEWSSSVKTPHGRGALPCAAACLKALCERGSSPFEDPCWLCKTRSLSLRSSCKTLGPGLPGVWVSLFIRRRGKSAFNRRDCVESGRFGGIRAVGLVDALGEVGE